MFPWYPPPIPLDWHLSFLIIEMKLIIAAIYSNFTSHIVDDDGVADQTDGYTARPSKERLYLRFETVE